MNPEISNKYYLYYTNLALKPPNWHRWMGNLIDRSPGLCIPKRIAQISKMLETRRQPQQRRWFLGTWVCLPIVRISGPVAATCSVHSA